MPTFVNHLRMIHAFVCRGDSFDCLPAVVCGLEFGPSSFLINTRQLKKPMSRPKSSFCFQRQSSSVHEPSRDIASLLGQMPPRWAPISSPRGNVYTERQLRARADGDIDLMNLLN
jgi:hypothetical protein